MYCIELDIKYFNENFCVFSYEEIYIHMWINEVSNNNKKQKYAKII